MNILIHSLLWIVCGIFSATILMPFAFKLNSEKNGIYEKMDNGFTAFVIATGAASMMVGFIIIIAELSKEFCKKNLPKFDIAKIINNMWGLK